MTREPIVIEQAEIAGWLGVPKRAMLEDTPLRRELLATHPALKGQLCIATPMAREMYRTFKLAIVLGEQGPYYAGAPNDGRTSALRICLQLLDNDYPTIASYYHCSTEIAIFRETVALQDMLSSAGHEVLTGTIIPLRERLVAKIVDDLRRRGNGHTAVWCVDNAHNMQQRELEVLADLQHRLWQCGVQFLTVMMTDADSSVGGATSNSRSCAALLAHFFGHKRELRGLSNPGDLNKILDAFDTLDFPEGTNVRWTEFFLPRAYANGFRLEGEGVHLYEALTHCFPDPKEGAPTMGVLFSAIRWALVRRAGFDDADFRFLPQDWKEAVDYAIFDGSYVPPRLKM